MMHPGGNVKQRFTGLMGVLAAKETASAENKRLPLRLDYRFYMAIGLNYSSK